MYQISEISNKNILLNQLILKNEELNFKAEIYPNLGASLQKYELNNIEILDGISNDKSGLKIYKSKFNSAFLFPFPSRIPEGKYTFNGKEYQVSLNEPALKNALHGHIHNKYFTVKRLEATTNFAKIHLSYTNKKEDKGYPFSYKIDLVYTFSDKKLDISYKISNIGKTTMPFGIGWHPYFKTSNLNEAILNFESDSQLFFNTNMQPEGEQVLKYKLPFIIENSLLDDGFILKNPNAIFKTNDYQVKIEFSSKSPNSFLQVYTPPKRKSIAIEPMTCAPNCFNNKKGLLTLAPQKQYNWHIKLDLN
jgi:aldose 1-epimerase